MYELANFVKCAVDEGLIWFQTNNLKLNFDKTQNLVFSLISFHQPL